MAGAEDQLELRVVDLEEAVEVFFEVGLGAVEGLEDADGREEVLRGRALLAALAPGEADGSDEDHRGVDGGGNGSGEGDVEQGAWKQAHRGSFQCSG